jgi:hypothetical protein
MMMAMIIIITITLLYISDDEYFDDFNGIEHQTISDRTLRDKSTTNNVIGLCEVSKYDKTLCSSEKMLNHDSVTLQSTDIFKVRIY